MSKMILILVRLAGSERDSSLNNQKDTEVVQGQWTQGD